MGMRNPFRFAVNRTNGPRLPRRLLAGRPGRPDPARGPEGIGRWMLIRSAANYGWPFCITPDQPYVDYDFTPDARSPARSSTASGRSTTRATTPACGSCRRSPSRRSGTRTTRARICSRSCSPQRRRQRHRPDGRPGDAVRRAASRRRSGGRASSRATRSSTSGRATTRRCSSSTGRTATSLPTSITCSAARRPEPERRAGQPHGHGVRSGERPLHARVRHGLLRRAPGGAAGADRLRTRRPVHAGRARHGHALVGDDRAADRPVLERGHDRPERRQPRLRVGLRLRRHGRLARRPTRRYTYTAKGIYEATLTRDRPDRALGVLAGAHRRRQPGADGVAHVVSTTPPFNFGDTVNYTVTVTDDQPVDCARVSVAYILGHETHGHPQTSTAGCTGRSRSRSTRPTPARRTSAPCSWPPTRTTRAAARRRSRAPPRSASCRPRRPARPGLVHRL